MIILKFGGTSVADEDCIKKVVEIIRNEQKEHGSLAVVVSAFGGITNLLIKTSNAAASGDIRYEKYFEEIQERHVQAIKALLPVTEQSGVLSEVLALCTKLREVLHGVYLIRESSLRSLDYILSFGERLSAFIISHALTVSGIDSEFLDARKLIITNEEFGSAKINKPVTYKNITEHFNKKNKLQVITGFIATTEDDATTTLGRGGSDYTAAVFAAALKASQIQIWTDVSGMKTADPRIVPNAKPIPQVTYQEAMEMSHFGAKVLHPPTLQPAMDLNIPIVIRNTFEPDFSGTLISNELPTKDDAVTGITSIPKVTLLRVQGSGLVGIPGIAKRLFGALADRSINIILITQASSEHTVCFGVSPEDAELACKAIEEEFELEISAHRVDPVIVEPDLSVLSIVGENMRHTRGIAAILFTALFKNDVNVIAIVQGSSEFNITVVIAESDLSRAIKSVHDSFFEGTKK